MTIFKSKSCFTLFKEIKISETVKGYLLIKHNFISFSSWPVQFWKKSYWVVWVKMLFLFSDFFTYLLKDTGNKHTLNSGFLNCFLFHCHFNKTFNFYLQLQTQAKKNATKTCLLSFPGLRITSLVCQWLLNDFTWISKSKKKFRLMFLSLKIHSESENLPFLPLITWTKCEWWEPLVLKSHRNPCKKSPDRGCAKPGNSAKLGQLIRCVMRPRGSVDSLLPNKD